MHSTAGSKRGQFWIGSGRIRDAKSEPIDSASVAAIAVVAKSVVVGIRARITVSISLPVAAKTAMRKAIMQTANRSWMYKADTAAGHETAAEGLTSEAATDPMSAEAAAAEAAAMAATEAAASVATTATATTTG